MTPRTDLTRRRLLQVGAAAPLAVAAPALLTGAGPRGGVDEVRALERRFGATIGFHAGVVGGRATLSHRADEPVPIHSVFKALLAAAVLRDLDRRGEVLERRITYTRADLVDYSPVTELHVDEGMTVRELCDAAVRISDNTAANLLLDLLGGPSAITRFARSLGDDGTRLDRWEPELNEATPGDPRDTTTPRAAAHSLTRLLVGRALSCPDRAVLRDWMLRNTTSDDRFRKGLPPGWRLADKTGSGSVTFNDAGVAVPPRGRPLVLSAFVRLPAPDVPASQQIHAELARIAVRRLHRER
ncbi:class A beta-lactamase [Solicola sp. PLA-1-18]|uniref:class A beta-lactamase n=1 Tax=Solicola sp. PLA-1-18 TaxID=3380532 RepID=UPI003B809212